MKIKFFDFTERSNVLRLSNKAILNNINKLFLALYVARIKKLLSRDLVIQTLTKDNYKSFIINQKWLISLRSTKVVLLERFFVFVYIVQITNIVIA